MAGNPAGFTESNSRVTCKGQRRGQRSSGECSAPTPSEGSGPVRRGLRLPQIRLAWCSLLDWGQCHPTK